MLHVNVNSASERTEEIVFYFIERWVLGPIFSLEEEGEKKMKEEQKREEAVCF